MLKLGIIETRRKSGNSKWAPCRLNRTLQIKMLQAISKAMSPAISSLLNPIQLNEYFAQEDTDEEGEM